MGPELAATDLWTHSVTAGMKAEKKVAKELLFLSSWDGESSGQWVRCWTLQGQPKETGHKALSEGRQGRAHKGGPPQTQHESQPEERMKAEGESETLGVPAFLS